MNSMQKQFSVRKAPQKGTARSVGSSPSDLFAVTEGNRSRCWWPFGGHQQAPSHPFQSQTEINPNDLQRGDGRGAGLSTG